MKDTLSERYARFPETRLRLNMMPMGTIVRLHEAMIRQLPTACSLESSHVRKVTNQYACRVMGTLCRESRTLVDRAKIWVIAVAKIWCHVVRNRADIELVYQSG